MKLTIPGDVPSQKNNKRILRNRQGAPFVASNDRVIAWKHYAVLQLRQQLRGKELPQPPLSAVLSFTLSNNRRHDLDNMAAGVMDALVMAGALPDDSVEFVTLLTLYYRGIDKKGSGVLIEIDQLA